MASLGFKCPKWDKVNSVQEPQILQATWKLKTKNIKSIGEKVKTKGLMFAIVAHSVLVQNKLEA